MHRIVLSKAGSSRGREDGAHSAVRVAQELTEVMLPLGNCFEMKTSMQARGHLSTKFQTNKTLFSPTHSAPGNIVSPKSSINETPFKGWNYSAV